jgi:hypothetical protein
MATFMKWHIFDTIDAANASFNTTHYGYGPGMNPETRKVFFEEMAERKKPIMIG